MAVVNSKIEATADLAKQIQEEILISYGPHQKLISERKLAKVLNTTHNRVHRAIQRLARERIVYTVIGDGTYLSGKDDSTAPHLGEISTFFNMMHLPHIALHKRIKVLIQVNKDPYQRKLWQKIIDAFMKDNPYFEIEVDFGEQVDVSAGYDISLISVYSLMTNLNSFSALDNDLLKKAGFDQDQLCPEICRPLSRLNNLFGIPILRTASVVWINKEILHRYGIEEDSIKEPVDILRYGHVIEEKSNGTVNGTVYHGFHWHASLYGINVEQEEEKLLFDRRKVRQFLLESKPYIKKHHLTTASQLLYQAFLSGKYAIYPNYFCIYPVMRQNPDTFTFVRSPMHRDGFTPEGTFVGCIHKGTKNQEEAHTLLTYLVSKEAQRLFVDNAPDWLSVRSDVLNQQKRQSPFPKGILQYEFDGRNHYSYFSRVIFEDFGPKLDAESRKFFLGLQDIDQTMAKLEYV